jgi:hypothetical protein
MADHGDVGPEYKVFVGGISWQMDDTALMKGWCWIWLFQGLLFTVIVQRHQHISNGASCHLLCTDLAVLQQQ